MKNCKKMLKERAKNIAIPNVLNNVKNELNNKNDKNVGNFDGLNDIIERDECVDFDFGTGFRGKSAGLVKLSVFGFGLIFVVGVIVVMLMMFNFDDKIVGSVSVDVGVISYSINVNKSEKVVSVESSDEGRLKIKNLKYKGRNFEVFIEDLFKIYIDNEGLIEEDLINVRFDVSCEDKNVKNSLLLSINNSIEVAKEHCRNKHGENGNNHNNNHH